MAAGRGACGSQRRGSGCVRGVRVIEVLYELHRPRGQRTGPARVAAEQHGPCCVQEERRELGILTLSWLRAEAVAEIEVLPRRSFASHSRASRSISTSTVRTSRAK